MIKHLKWDQWNVEHIARHHVEYWEVEELLQNDPLLIRMGRPRGRIHLIGRSDSRRYLAAFADPEDGDEYYVVTARDATSAERRRYARRVGR